MSLLKLADKALKGHPNDEIDEALKAEFVDGVSSRRDDSFGAEVRSVVKWAVQTGVRLDTGYIPGGIIGFSMHQLRNSMMLPLKDIGDLVSGYAREVSPDGSWKATWLNVAEGRGECVLVATRHVTDEILKSHFYAQSYMVKALRGDDDAQQYRFDIQNRLSPKEAIVFSQAVSMLEYLYGESDSQPRYEMLAELVSMLQQEFGDYSNN